MTAFSDTLALFRSSHSPVAAALFAINMSLMAARTKSRIRRFRTTRFEIDGVTYFANTWDGLLVLRPNHEPAVHDAVAKVANGAQGRGLFLNVGAHIGRYALEFAKHFERTIAFEPTPATFELLDRATSDHPMRDRIEVHQCCIGDRAGVVPLVMRGNESQNAVLMKGQSQSGEQVVRVPMNTLDSMLSPAARASVRLLLIDVEGAEELVLSGAHEILQNSDLTLIIELLNNDALERCSRLLSPMGYRGIRLDRSNFEFVK